MYAKVTFKPGGRDTRFDFTLRRLLEGAARRARGDDDHGDAGDVTGSDDAGRGHAAARLRQMRSLDRGSGA